MKRTYWKTSLAAMLMVLMCASLAHAQGIKSPEQQFGFKMGADYKLVKWPQMVEYLKMLAGGSDKIKVEEIGKSTEGNPIIVAYISSAQNLANLQKYKTISQRLANPRGLSKEEADRLVTEGKLIAAISCAIHASEIGSTQMSMELAYDLITKDTPQVREILDKVILLLMPSHNPDGNIMVVDWYNKTHGTQYENAPMPWLYQKYVGHDNNRDWFMLNLQETKVITKFYFQEWFPQVLYDLHQMGRSGARIFVPPFLDPLNPNIHPLIWRGNELFGTNMFRELEEHGKTGVVTNAMYTSWWEGNSLQQPWFHNMVSVLTEVASADIASPVQQAPSELTGNSPGLLEYALRANFTHPWLAGWWRLRDIVEYEYDAAMGFLDTSAKYKENFLRDFYMMGVDGIEKGQKEPPYAFVVPADQHDPNTAVKMINILIDQGAEVHRANAEFTAGNVKYPKGSYVLLLSQPFRPFVKDIMEPQVYPDLRWYPGGPPIPPYDVAGWTLPMQMGVNSVTVRNAFDADLTHVTKAEPPAVVTAESKTARSYILGHESNDSLTAVNRLLKAGYDVYWSQEGFTSGNKDFPPGTMIVPAKSGAQPQITTIAKELSLPLWAADGVMPGSCYKLKPLRLALYNPWGGNMDEGWCKLMFDQFEFPYTEIRNADIQTGLLNEKYDVILFADQPPQAIVNGAGGRGGEGRMPQEYSGGIGAFGPQKLRSFVERGGTLISLGNSAELFIKEFGLPVVNTLQGLKEDTFFCPGSILETDVDVHHPIAYGMEPKTLAFFARSAAYDMLPSFKPGDAQVVVKYAPANILKSGWMLGEKYLANKAALVDVSMGRGRVILFGFRVQNRAQPHGTFKLFFNALYYGPAMVSKYPSASP